MKNWQEDTKIFEVLKKKILEVFLCSVTEILISTWEPIVHEKLPSARKNTQSIRNTSSIFVLKWQKTKNYVGTPTHGKNAKNTQSIISNTWGITQRGQA